MIVTVNCFSGWKNTLLAMIFLLGSPPFPHLRCPIGGLISLTSCPRVLFILNIKGGSTRTMFRHHDVSFKNSNMDSIKEYMPQNHDHQNMVLETG